MIYGRIKRYFSPKSITIASLRPNQIDEFYQSIFDEGMVANTVIHYHAQHHAFIKQFNLPAHFQFDVAAG